MNYDMLSQEYLRRSVALAQGWTFKVKDYLINAVRPDGYHYPSDLFWPNAWKHVPNYPVDLNAAWDLFPPDVHIELSRLSVTRHRLRVTDTDHDVDTFWEADTAPRAICVAYLHWHARVEAFNKHLASYTKP